MDLIMLLPNCDPRHLHEEEIRVELMVRGIRGWNDNAVSQLREAMQAEDNGWLNRPSAAHKIANENDELTSCHTILNDLCHSIRGVADQPTWKEADKIHSRLAHLLHRVLRFQVANPKHNDAEKLITDIRTLVLNNYWFREYIALSIGTAQNQNIPILYSQMKHYPIPPATPVKSGGKWESIDAGQLLIFTSNDLQFSPKVAGFDIDGTIIRTKSGSVFPKYVNDWQFAFAEVPAALRSLHSQHFQIVFFTNQGGICKGKVDASEWQRKCENIVRDLGIPVQVFVSTGYSNYRKPKTAMWNILATERNGGIEVDMQHSFYVGDAAGRAATDRRPKDHSLDDRWFALNVGVPFKTPEEYFQGVAPELFTPTKFMPTVESKAAKKRQDIFYPIGTDGKPKVIVIVGAHGSGKSHFLRTVLEPQGFIEIYPKKQDTRQTCIETLESTLRQNKSAVIDDNHLDLVSRSHFMQLANKLNVSCLCFVMTTSLAQMKHKIAFNELVDPQHSGIPDFMLVGMWNQRMEPLACKGYEDVACFKCVPKFSDEQLQRLYGMYLLDK